MEKNSNTPQIRFRGCQGEWEKKALKELCSFSKGKGFSKSEIRKSGSPLLLYGSLYTDYRTNINDVKIFAQKQDWAVLSKGDEVVLPASGECAEDIARASAVTVVGIMLGGDLNIVVPDKSINTIYLALDITHGSAHRQLVQCAHGATVSHLHNNDIANCRLRFPSRNEQSRIAECFEKIDALVSRQRERVERLRKLKAALLDKLFPKPGHNTPEVRVNGCAGEWEIVKASNVFANISDKGHPQLPVLSASQELGMIPRDETGINMSYSLQNVMSYKRVMPGQFVIHLRSFQGGFAHSAIDGITSPAYTVLGFKDKERHCDSFWKYILVSKEFIRRLENVTYGIRDGKSIKYEDFADMEFQVPECSEQLAISSLLMKYDRLTSLHEAKLAKLRQLKLSLLDKMFV